MLVGRRSATFLLGRLRVNYNLRFEYVKCDISFRGTGAL
jgi:hypothetical protein